MDYSREVDTDATGAMILEFNPADLASLLIVVDSAAYWGLGDLSQAITPIVANSTVALDWQAFPPEYRDRNNMQNKTVRIFMKRQAAGTLKCYINFIGRS